MKARAPKPRLPSLTDRTYVSFQIGTHKLTQGFPSPANYFMARHIAAKPVLREPFGAEKLAETHANGIRLEALETRA